MFRKSTKIHHHGTGDAVARSTLIVVCLLLLCFAQPAHGLIETTGDVQPADPATWDDMTGAYIGKDSNGTLDITGGSDVIDWYSYIGYSSDVTGKVTVDGPGSTWTGHYTGPLNVGYYGSGTLNITNGGAVSSDSCEIAMESGPGEITVDGSGSILTTNSGSALDVGGYGNGTLNVTNGGAVSSGYAHISWRSGGTGAVTVDGAGSIWTNSSHLTVGSNGNNGTLNITDGGTVNNTGVVHIGCGCVGEATVNGTGSILTSSDTYVGGYAGSGTLNITGGGVVSNSTGRVGASNYSTGEVTVDGAGSTWTNTDLNVGYSGDGTLIITGGGLVSAEGLGFGTYYYQGHGFVNMAGGGMLALEGEAADSLDDFMDLISGTDAIRYWDDSISDWADITGATMGEDYWLDYLSEGDLAGYTMLTVGVVPEPSTLAGLLGLCLAGLLGWARRGQSRNANPR